MSQEEVLKTLIGLGLTKLDSEVYIFLAKRGPLKGAEICHGLKSQKQPLYRSLKSLQSRGIVNATLERPATFVAVSFDKVIDIFVKTKMAEAQRIQENKNEILAHWQAISIGETEDSSAKFSLIEGRGPIYSKILRMMNEARQLSTITSVTGLVRADQFGLFKKGLANQIRDFVKFRALVEISPDTLVTTKKLLKEISSSKISFEGRTPEISINLPQLVIKDDEEILFFITPKTNSAKIEQGDACIWTNCKSLVQAFTTVFEEYWRHAASINAKIAEFESGKPAPKTQIIEDAELASRKYSETMKLAQKEVTIVTSSTGLSDLWENKPIHDVWTQKGVSVRIMAPITSKNLDAAQLLSSHCQVRHIPLGYLGTTIVDGSHLFQFKDTPGQTNPGSKLCFENTFYTNDLEYVQKTNNMLNEIWINAQMPSQIKFESTEVSSSQDDANSFSALAVTKTKVQGPTIVENVSLTKISEKDVLNKIMNPKKYQTRNPSCKVRTYGVNAQAIVHPPIQLNLPDIMFHFFHMEKQSIYGIQDAMLIHFWLETPKGFSYVPTVFITDNSRAACFWKKFLAGTPAGQNVILVKKNQLEVRSHANVLFAAWTIQVSSPPYLLPPCCVQVEGTGAIKSQVEGVEAPSGYTMRTEYNGCEGFVTFIHPSSNYSGPGTDGIFGRDVIMEFSIPKKQNQSWKNS